MLHITAFKSKVGKFHFKCPTSDLQALKLCLNLYILIVNYLNKCSLSNIKAENGKKYRKYLKIKILKIKYIWKCLDVFHLMWKQSFTYSAYSLNIKYFIIFQIF